jgi:hypothetical protein
MRRLLIALALACVCPHLALAQKAKEQIAKGDNAYARRQAREALTFYLAVIAGDSNNAAALWRASRTEAELAEFDTDSARADTLLASAERQARGAERTAPKSVEAHFALAQALGRIALRTPKEERLPFATETHTEVESCLAIESGDAACLHVLGVWEAEYMRLGTFTREIANTMTGGKLFAGATWEDAEAKLRASIAAEPKRAIHHLDLARIYRDQQKTAEAKMEYEAVLASPVRDYNDEHYMAEAKAALGAQ